MKKATLVICLAMVMVLGIAGVALANTSSGYLTPSGSPHGAYTTSSKDCGVCHAVHKATPAGQVLMRGTVADACTYCHIDTASGLIRIYNGVSVNYTAPDTQFAHNSSGAPCTGCHTPHGALTLIANNAYLEKKILKGEVGVAPLVGDSADVAVSKWCTNCHTYYETAYDTSAAQSSHVMKAPAVSYSGAGASGTYAGTVAWTTSATCRDCHADGTKNNANGSTQVIASSFPHFTVGERFLTAAGNNANNVAAVSATDSEADGVCIRCHVSVGAGSGLTY